MTESQEISNLSDSWPKITIITPTYNQGQYIEQTITSVLNQNYPNLEYIIIDGGSTDNTVEIIKKYESQLTYWVSEKDNGQSDAINKGLKLATGDIINWLNSDDYYTTTSLFDVAEKFRENKNIHCVAARSIIVSNECKELFCNYGTWVDYKSKSNTFKYLMIEQPATFFSSHAINQMGLVSEDLHYIMDKEWWLRYLILFELSSIALLNKPVVYFRFQPNSKTVSLGDKFNADLANVMYFISKQKNMLKISNLLSEKYEIDNTYYLNSTFVDRLRDDDFETMVKFFCLKNFSLVFSRKDFYLARKCLAIFSIKTSNMDYVENQYYNRLVRNTRFNFWLLNRIFRKLTIIK